VSGTLTTTAGVSNSGPGAASAVTLTTTLPSQVSGVTGLAAACAFNAAAHTVTCTAGSLASGSSSSYTYTAHVSLLTLGALPVSTTASGTTTDPVPANNTSSGTCTILTSFVIAC
jgi:hypothetical protein